MSDSFRRDNALGQALLEWWQELADQRAQRAILRRAPNVTALILSPPFQLLHRRLQSRGWNPDGLDYRNERLAVIAGLLAHVHADAPGVSPAQSFSASPGERPAVSELRFLRLLDESDTDGLLRSLRRVLPLVERRLDVLALANDVLHWGDKTKKNWAYSYDWPARAGD